MLGMIIALISGALMSIQGVLNTQLTKQTSVWVSNSWVQFSALIICLGAWAVTDRKSFAMLWQVEHKYVLLGGIIGAVITLTVILSMKNLGPAQAALLIVVAQLAVAYVIELFGWFEVEKTQFSWVKLVGLLIAVGGITLFQLKK